MKPVRVWSEPSQWGWLVFGASPRGEGSQRKEVAGPFTTKEAAQAWVDGWHEGKGAR